MIHLHMIRYHIVDITRVDNLFDPPPHLREERRLDCVYESDFLIDDEIGVVGSATMSRIPMKVPDVPVNGANPVNAFC